MDNAVAQKCFEIIFAAGNARAECEKALTALETGNLEAVEDHMKEAKKEITAAHTIHTEMLQSEIQSPGSIEYNMLVAHAQDTLMTINSELLLAKHIIALFKKISVNKTE